MDMLRIPNCLVNIDDIHIKPFGPNTTSAWQSFTLRINKQRYVKGRRFWARTLCKIFPWITQTQYDVETPSGIRARVALDNAHDFWLFSQGDDLEAEYKQCLAAALAEYAGASEFNYVDIGGNTGIVAAITISETRRALGPSLKRIRCVAVEPQDDLIVRLATNLKWNAEGADLWLFHCALGDHFGQVHLDINSNNRGGSHIRNSRFGLKRTRLVPLTHVLATSKLARIDLLKIDVEGSEYSVLGPFLKECDRSMLPRFIFTEIKNDFDGSLAAILSASGYQKLWDCHEDAFFRLQTT